MNSIFLLYYAIVLLIILGGGVMVYRRVARRNRLLGVFAGLLSSAALVLIWPIPIHGGFTFLGAIMLDELIDQWEQVEEKSVVRKDERFLQSLETRFSGTLKYERVIPLAGDWSTVTLSDGGTAWLDNHSGLIWSEPQGLTTDNPLDALEAGKALCRNYVPAGYWALPTEAERYQFWRAAGKQYLPHNVAPAMGYIVDDDIRMVLPSVSLPASGLGNNATRGAISLMLRCVARGAGAPARGYIRSDISISEWNRYQLAKVGNNELDLE